MLLARLLNGLKILLVGLFFIIVISPEWPAFQGEKYALDSILGQRHFDFVVWEAGTLVAKTEAYLTGGHQTLGQETRKRLVLDYLASLDEVRRLEAQVSAIYSDPAIEDPEQTARDMQQQIGIDRAELDRRQPIVEAIIQDQVATVLAEQGFDLLGATWPPVQMHMTPLPYVLVVSPREEIRQIYNIPLEHGLPVAAREEIETSIFGSIDRSALVVPIGGIGIFPSMVVETGNINFLADVVAHEWAHHWLTFHPLGLNYAASPELRTINETVASVVGGEIGAMVIERFYPEYIPPPPAPAAGPTVEEDEELPAFDSNAELAETRVRVDELLAQGQVDEAEAYMEQRRQFLWEHDYRIRKINQAFFAFYGAYADTPGEQGDDPIGPTLLAIREGSPSLRHFMDRVATVTSLEELQEVATETSPD